MASLPLQAENEAPQAPDTRRVIAQSPWSKRYLVSHHGPLCGPDFWGLDIAGPKGYVVDMQIRGGMRCASFSLCALLSQGTWIPAVLSEEEEREVLDVDVRTVCVS